jgi:hypothetical protein
VFVCLLFLCCLRQHNLQNPLNNTVQKDAKIYCYFFPKIKPRFSSSPARNPVIIQTELSRSHVKHTTDLLYPEGQHICISMHINNAGFQNRSLLRIKFTKIRPILLSLGTFMQFDMKWLPVTFSNFHSFGSTRYVEASLQALLTTRVWRTERAFSNVSSCSQFSHSTVYVCCKTSLSEAAVTAKGETNLKLWDLNSFKLDRCITLNSNSRVIPYLKYSLF